jgi:peptide/nickel transport system substrate-binding protein
MVLSALHDALGKPMPGNPAAPPLGTPWSLSPDGLVHEFVLRRGVKFHNGDTVTAEAPPNLADLLRGDQSKAVTLFGISP